MQTEALRSPLLGFGLALALATGGGWSCSPAAPDTPAEAGSDGSGGGMNGQAQPPPPTYLGGWTIGDCQDEIKGTGFGLGDTAPDFALLGQHGETIRLHSFCDRVVLLLGAAFW